APLADDGPGADVRVNGRGRPEAATTAPAADPAADAAQPKLGRNDPCWCGSGKKFKFCHGAA
ncbi:MAG: SEC-C metal-binding domain-containing protein, partial [Acidimicrobiales bacterium]